MSTHSDSKSLKIGVDSGLLLLVDPCNLDQIEPYEELVQLEGESEDNLNEVGWSNYESCGVLIGGFGGDGNFRLIPQLDPETGVLERVIIDFRR